MKNKIMINAIIILIIMTISTPATALYRRGKVFKDISYEDFEINRNTGEVTFIMINNNTEKVTIFVKAQFCSIFDEYYGQIYVQKTIPPRGKKYIKERLYDRIEDSSGAHHINWYVKYYKVGDKVIINRLGDID